MNCEWFETRLNELLDERLPPDGDMALNAHAEHCRHCARLLADHQALLEAMELLAWPIACDDLGPRVLAEVRREADVGAAGATSGRLARAQASCMPESGIQPVEAAGIGASKRHLRHAAGWVAAATAAALLVGVGVMHWGRGPQTAPVAGTKSPVASTGVLADAKPEPSTPGLPARSLDLSSVAGGESFVGLLSPQQRVLVEQMTDGLKPVTHSMSAALRALRRTLPGSEAPARSS